MTLNDQFQEIERLDGVKYINHIPEKYWTKRKLENLIRALEEEKIGRVELDSMPYSVIIEPTNICNLKCPLCSTGLGNESRKKGTITVENFYALVDKCKKSCLELYLQNWGEPTLVRDLPRMVKYAAENGIYTILSTNFSMDYREGYVEELVQAGLGLLHIDIDGTTQDVYEIYRKKGKLELVLENTRRAVAVKKKEHREYPIIETNFLVMQHNEHQIDSFRELSRQLQVDKWQVGKIQVNPNTSLSWLPKNKEYLYDNYLTQEETTKPCHRLWSTLVVNWDGNIAACCLVDDVAADFGNVFGKTIRELWNTRYFVSSRAYFTDKSRITTATICHQCRSQINSKRLKRYKESYSLIL